MLHKIIIFLIIISSVACAPRQIRTVAISDIYNKGIKLAHALEPEVNKNQHTSICFELNNNVNEIQPIINSSTNKVFEQYNLLKLINEINPDHCEKKALTISNIETKSSRHPMSIRLTIYIGKVKINTLSRCHENNILFYSSSRQKIKIHEFHSSDEGYALSSASIYLALKAALLDMEQQYKKACL